MCTCTCTRICTCTCTYIHIHICICTCAYMYVYMYIHPSDCSSIHSSIHLSIHPFIHSSIFLLINYHYFSSFKIDVCYDVVPPLKLGARVIDKCSVKKCVTGENGEVELQVQDISSQCTNLTYCPKEYQYTPEGACCPVCECKLDPMNCDPF